jgi:hypothetical protein
MVYGNSALINCLLLINEYIIEDGLDLSNFPETLVSKHYSKDVIEDVRNAITNIKESCKDEKDEEIYNTAKTLETLGINSTTQLSINNAIENIDQYIENGGFEDIKLDPKPVTSNFNQSRSSNRNPDYIYEDDHYMWKSTPFYGYQEEY